MRKRILAPVLAVLLTATLGSASPPPEPPECVAAAAWVRVHPDQMPTTLAGLSRHSKLYRRAIYDVLPPAAREAMWREQLEPWLRPGTPLTATQQAAVRNVITHLPALTAVHPDRALGRSLQVRLATQFDRSQMRGIFLQLGGPVPGQPAVGSANSRRPTCDCADNGECAEGESCKPVICWYSSGCGVAGSDTCTGYCLS